MYFCLCDLLLALLISALLELGSPNRGDSLDRNINEENRATKDFLILVSLLFLSNLSVSFCGIILHGLQPNSCCIDMLVAEILCA